MLGRLKNSYRRNKNETEESVVKNGKMPVESIKKELLEDDSMDVDDNNMNDSVDSQVEEEEHDAMQVFGPAALGLQRVGTEPPPKPKPAQQPKQVLNARGMPARIRKKNRLFYDDALVNHPHHRVKKDPDTTPVKPSPKKQVRPSPLKRHTRLSNQKKSVSTPSTPVTKPIKIVLPTTFEKRHPLQPSSPDRKIGQKIGMRLRNLLKLPKAHKWVCYEWFYSNIDKTLFEGDNDFLICLNESFPQLKTHKLTRTEWGQVRRMMGKPRRCSQAFFEEERKELDKKRQKIRLIQQRKTADSMILKDLPSEIPLQLVIGTKVTARLRKPQDGLFTGVIDAVDTSNNTYRITFDRAGLGTHSVPDYEVLSNDPPETISRSSISHKFRPRSVQQFANSSAYAMKMGSPRLHNDPLISNATITKKMHAGEANNSYPVKLLENMVKVGKIIAIKKIKIKHLKDLNSEAERKKSVGENLPSDFERKYAGIVVELERMNTDLQELLNEIQDMCREIAPESSVAAMLAPSHLREKCRHEASEMVAKNNMVNESPQTSLQQLVIDLTALMLQVKCLSDSDKNAYELKVLQGTMEQIKAKLSPSNKQVFQNNVEIHMQHIQLGLGQVGVLTPFMTQKI
ncbi:protein lin-9 homolog isoform X2 [Trichogramma pretiosum]|uniref:protein lin-9 homolog isoform X2 n=1 Tax=Trichogramma pretiosum TaxID=7493 RepID=UPI0006C9A252|nr:protein lin-9 homolog isoform X2 [Trichogramma pretiosum]XP_014232321.1 protein lin-9 homolog isoform X2 [Trichogramma pretiosum]XP_014232329.1 protein lin-9 homolog isoform X2 [Trichogramma pretiosum]XP_014232336.1 protein lin-9 homolog isoform X2 [Trichogramma pretiosum]XP_023318518.1 protein lin-9 homolog isoform X2 [Trichogramma pretiosum]